MMYSVTATALNLRATAAATGTKLATLPKNAVVSALDDPSPTPGWLKVTWNGMTGYASAQYLQPTSSTVSAPSPSLIAPPAPPVDQRDRDLSKVHPVVRAALQQVLADLEQKGLPFRIFEGFRTPERQNYLYAPGHTAPGPKVTNARAWQSMHQYGLAADLVLFVDGKWSWGGQSSDWKAMHEAAEKHGLQFLSFEAPHVELKGADWREYLKGNFPKDGDETWYDAVMGAARRWKLGNGSPAGPEPVDDERPPLPDQSDPST